MSFFDHFPGSVLDTTYWTGVTAGTGSITVANSFVRFARPVASGDAAYAYYKNELDKTKSQIWACCFNINNSNFKRPIMIRNTSTPGTPLNFDTADHVIQVQVAISTNYYCNLEYFDSGGTRWTWNPSTNAWQSGAATVTQARTDQDNWVVVGIEFDADGGNSRFRLHCWTVASPTDFDWAQGLRYVQLTDWVNWSGAQTAQNDLYMFIGHPYNDILTDTGTDIEWVAFEDDGREVLFVNGRTEVGDNFDIRRWWGFGQRRIFVKEDRSTVLIGASGSGWRQYGVKDPNVLKLPDNTHVLLCDGDGASGFQIGGFTAGTDPFSTWTEYGSNPIIAGTPSSHQAEVFFPYLLCDLDEPDSNKRYKLFHGAWSTLDSQFRVYYKTAPNWYGTYTDQGIIIGPSGTGWRQQGCNQAIVFWHGGQWEVWAVGYDVSGFWRVGRFYGTDLTSLSEDGSNPFLTWQADGQEDLTASLAGLTATMSSTTGFTADAVVYFDRDATANNFIRSKIRVVNAGSLTLYHALTATNSPTLNAKQSDAFRGYTVSHIEYVDGEWQFWGTPFKQFDDHATYRAYDETAGMWKHSNADPGGAVPTIDHSRYLMTLMSSYEWGDERSVENPAFVREPKQIGCVTVITNTVTVLE